MVTFTLAGLFMGAIKWFSGYRVMSDHKDYFFNAISTGSSMTLGMSITAGFKAMAIDLGSSDSAKRIRAFPEGNYI